MKTFNIYCDESTHIVHDHHPYMVLSYVGINYGDIPSAREQIKAIRLKHNYYGELKWTNVHEATYPVYKDLVDFFFMTRMRFRAVIVDKSQIDETRPEYTFNDFYYRMYFQLLHNNIDMECQYNVFIDIKDTCSKMKLRKLHEILKYSTPIGNIQFIKYSYFPKSADILLYMIIKIFICEYPKSHII